MPGAPFHQLPRKRCRPNRLSWSEILLRSPAPLFHTSHSATCCPKLLSSHLSTGQNNQERQGGGSKRTACMTFSGIQTAGNLQQERYALCCYKTLDAGRKCYASQARSWGLHPRRRVPAAQAHTGCQHVHALKAAKVTRSRDLLRAAQGVERTQACAALGTIAGMTPCMAGRAALRQTPLRQRQADPGPPWFTTTLCVSNSDARESRFRVIQRGGSSCAACTHAATRMHALKLRHVSGALSGVYSLSTEILPA